MMKNHTNNNRINSPSQNSGIKPIRHAPNAWSVTQMIDQAPRGMMIRELVKNLPAIGLNDRNSVMDECHAVPS